jgi:GT2 family glycosyltransferase
VASCLQSDYENFNIIVIDNHSSDDSVARIRKAYPQVSVEVAPDNLGYAGGNNIGIKKALVEGADYVFILNNDVTIDRSAVNELMAAAERESRVGIMAPKVLFYDDPGSINSMGTTMDWFKMRSHLGEFNKKDVGNYPEITEKDVLLGCALFVPRKTIETVGFIEERFFLIHEEADWCFRCLRKGLRNITVSRATVFHKASKTMREFSTLSHYYSTRNFLFLAQRNARFLEKLSLATGLPLFCLKHLKDLLFAGNRAAKAQARAFFSGISDYFLGKMGKCERVFL